MLSGENVSAQKTQVQFLAGRSHRRNGNPLNDAAKSLLNRSLAG